MSHTRRFAVATALAASRIVPEGTPVLGSLVRTGLMTFTAGAAVAYAFAALAQDADRPAAGKRPDARDAGADAGTDAEPDYEELTRDDLYRIAQELDVSGRSRLSKRELIAAIRACR